MKKIFLLILLCIICSTVNAQKVISDEVTSDGIRAIICESVFVTGMSDKVKLEVALHYYADSIHSSYLLNLRAISSSPYKISKGMKLLLKDVDGNVVELEAINDADASVSEVHNINGFVYSDYSKAASYEISEETVRQLGKGVLKLRQEHSTGMFEKEWKKDKMGSILKKELAEIRHKASIKKDFHSDF